MERPPGRMAESEIEGSSHVSVNTNALQSLISRLNANLALNSSSLLSTDGMLASRKLGSGGRCCRFLNFTRIPARLPRFLRRRLFTGIQGKQPGKQLW